jgi:hypothetical protein
MSKSKQPGKVGRPTVARKGRSWSFYADADMSEFLELREQPSTYLRELVKADMEVRKRNVAKIEAALGTGRS